MLFPVGCKQHEFQTAVRHDFAKPFALPAIPGNVIAFARFNSIKIKIVFHDRCRLPKKSDA
jgi:hypothetical protein